MHRFQALDLIAVMVALGNEGFREKLDCDLIADPELKVVLGGIKDGARAPVRGWFEKKWGVSAEGPLDEAILYQLLYKREIERKFFAFMEERVRPLWDAACQKAKDRANAPPPDEPELLSDPPPGADDEGFPRDAPELGEPGGSAGVPDEPTVL